jgi:hypothetical protein
MKGLLHNNISDHKVIITGFIEGSMLLILDYYNDAESKSTDFFGDDLRGPTFIN